MPEEKNEQVEEETEAAPEAETPEAEASVGDAPETTTQEADEEPEEPVEEAAEAVAEAPSSEEDVAEDKGAEQPAVAAEAVPTERKKRKRLPRSERRQRPKAKRATSGERKPIVRLPKPEVVRGRRQERQGTVVSAASDKTIVVRVDVVKVHPRYKKVVRRSTKLHAHDEQNQAKVGDVVRIVETRPLSRMKRWRLREIVEAAK